MNVPSLRPESPPSITVEAYTELHEAPFTSDYRRDAQAERLLEFRKNKRRERVEAIREKNSAPRPVAVAAAAFAPGEFLLVPAAGSERVEAAATAAIKPTKKAAPEKLNAGVAAPKPVKPAGTAAAAAKPLMHASPLIVKKPKAEQSNASGAVQKDQKEAVKKVSEKELFEAPAAASMTVRPQELTAKIAEHRALLLKLAPENCAELLAELLETEKRLLEHLSAQNAAPAFLEVIKNELEKDLFEQTKRMIKGDSELNRILEASIQKARLHINGMASDVQVEIALRIQREAEDRLDNQYNL